MPKYEITSPEGKKYEITAPEGASQDQVLAYAKSHFAAAPPAPTEAPKDEVTGPISYVGDIGKELGHEYMESGRYGAGGLKQLEAVPERIGRATKETAAGRGREGVKEMMGALGDIPSGVGKVAEGLLGQAGSVFTAPLASTVGRPLEKLTKGAVPRETTGAALSMAMPAGEAIAAEREASALAKQLGISTQAANRLIAKLKVRPGSETMRTNVEAMDRLGIKPSSVIAAPSSAIRSVARTVGQNPILGLPVRAAVGRAVEGTKTAAQRAADTLAEAGTQKSGAGPLSAQEAGKVVKRGVERFMEPTEPEEKMGRERLSAPAQEAMEAGAKRLKSRDIGFGRKAEILYGRVNKMVGNGKVAMPETQAALNDIRYRINEPGMIDFQVHPEVVDLARNLDAIGGMHFDNLRRLRTSFRENLMKEEKLRTPQGEAEINNIYAAMTRDLSNGAEKLGGPQARHALGQTDAMYAAGMARRANALDPIFHTEDPEQVFNHLVRMAQAGPGSNLTDLMRVRRSLPKDEWRDFAASMIDQMGYVKPSERTAEHDFSFRTFMTNFNKLDRRGADMEKGADTGLKVLFDGAGYGDVYDDLKAIARVTGEMRESDKLMSHPLTAQSIQTMVTGGAIMEMLFDSIHGNFGRAGATAASLGTAGALSWLLENPSVARYLADLSGTKATTAADEYSRLFKAAGRDPHLIPLLGAFRQLMPRDDNSAPQP